MNTLPIEQAAQNFVPRQRSKYTDLRDSIRRLADDQALYVSFDEYAEKQIHANVAILRRSREGAKLSVRRHADGTGCFVFYTTIKG